MRVAQVYSSPPVTLAHPPAAGVVDLPRPVLVRLVLPVPSWPERLPAPAPQGAVGAGGAVWAPPAVTLAHPPAAGAVTCRGRSWLVWLPVPSWPLKLIAPAPQGAVGAGGAGVVAAGGDAGPPACCRGGDLPRPVLVGVVADAELAVEVGAPAPQGGVSANTAAVERACGYVGPGGAGAHPAGSRVLPGGAYAGVAGCWAARVLRRESGYRSRGHEGRQPAHRGHRRAQHDPGDRRCGRSMGLTRKFRVSPRTIANSPFVSWRMTAGLP